MICCTTTAKDQRGCLHALLAAPLAPLEVRCNISILKFLIRKQGPLRRQLLVAHQVYLQICMAPHGPVTMTNAGTTPSNSLGPSTFFQAVLAQRGLESSSCCSFRRLVRALELADVPKFQMLFVGKLPLHPSLNFLRSTIRYLSDIT